MESEALVVRAQRGDQAAEERLLQEYKNLVLGKARRYFIVGADGDDVVQEGMIGLFKAIRSFSPDGGAKFKTYAEICIDRQIIDAIKAAKRKKHEPLNMSLHLHGDGSAPMEVMEAQGSVDAEETVVARDIALWIEKNSQNMFSPLERGVWRHYTEGKTYDEIAQALGKDLKSIHNAMNRMKKKIRKTLDEYHG